LFFDVQDVFRSFQWQSMRTFLDRTVAELGFHSYQNPDVPELLSFEAAINNLTITVVALERSIPCRASLVVATGGYHDRMETDGGEHQYLLRPRNVSLHGIRTDEDWIQVAISTPRSQLHWHDGGGGETYHGLSLSHQW